MEIRHFVELQCERVVKERTETIEEGGRDEAESGEGGFVAIDLVEDHIDEFGGEGRL